MRASRGTNPRTRRGPIALALAHGYTFGGHPVDRGRGGYFYGIEQILRILLDKAGSLL